MRFAFTMFALLLPLTAAAQASFSGARSAALAGATSGLPDDVRGDANPASWARVERWGVLLHGAQLYGLPELRYADALFLAPLGRGAAAVGTSTFGYELYRAHTLEIGYARQAAVGTFRTVGVGIRMRWHVVRIAGYGRAAAAGLSAGLHLPVTPFLTLGVGAHNLAVRGALRSDLPRRLTIGASFRASPAFTVTGDVNKDVRSPASLAGGVEVALVPALALRAGVASSPARVAGGVGIRLPHLEADVAAVRHDVLGWSPSLSLLFTW